MKNVFKTMAFTLLGLVLSINLWGAEGDTHVVTPKHANASGTQLNNNATIKPDTIAELSYPIKKLVINAKTNKSASSVSISVFVGNQAFGDTKNAPTNTTGDVIFESSTAMSGDIIINYTNNSGSGSGKGTLTINSYTVTEGAAATPAYTITAQSNNTNYGTVALDGSTITATPKSGYRISATKPYEVTSGTAEVEQNDNTFKVTPSTNCTVQINFEAKGCTDHSGTNVTSGTSTSYTYGPVDPYYKYSTRQILYTKTDLGLAAGKKGTIKSIYFEYASSTAMTKKTDVTIYMANTNLTALSKSAYVPYSEFTEVYSGSLNCAQGWNEISLTTPFVYNGSGSLVVLIDDNSGAYESSREFKYHTANTTTGAQIYKRNDSNEEDPSSTDWSSYDATNYRPNTKFCIEEAEMTKATVTWYVNSVSKHSQIDYPGTNCTAPTTPTTSDCDGSKVFVGWTATQNYESASAAPSDLFTDPTTKTIPDGGANYYAVFADKTGDETEYVRITQLDELSDGMSLVVVGDKNSHLLKNNISSASAPTESNSKIMVTPSTDAWTLRASGAKWQLCNSSGALGASSTSNGTSVSINNNNNTWTVGKSSSGTNNFYFNVSGTICLEDNNGSWVVYSNNSYTSSNYFTLRLYKANVSFSNYATKCCTPWTAPTLTYTASASIGANLSPSWGDGTTYGTLTYSSSDEDVLEVNATSGVVTTKTAGTAHVIASWSSVDDYCDNSTISNDITVTAAYNITYKDKGGTDFSGIHEEGYPQKHTYGTATTLKSASKDYYTFNGWFANESCTGSAIQTVAADAYTADFTLYAKWTPIEYNINYTLNGGTNASGNPATYTYETETITLQDPSKTGHDFQGWFKESTFENQVTTIAKGSHGNVDLYANWSVKSYTLTWDLNGGSVKTAGTTAGSVVYGTILTAPTVERTGYKFTGWKKGDVSIDFTKTVTMPAENATYVAQWTPQVYDITYKDQNGADYSGSNLALLPQKHTYGQETQLVDGVKVGYEFKGWFGNQECSGSPVTSILGTTYTSSFTLYAKWQVKTTTVTLSQADATTKGKEEVVATYGQPMPEATMPQREHYQFAGYKHSSTLYYNADGSSAKNWDKEDETVTLTAQWIINKNKVIFTNVLDGGTIKVNNQTSTINEVDYNSTVTITATPSAHYTLTALTYQVGENTPVSIKDNPSFKMPDADVTIAATFTEDTKVNVTWHIGAGSQETEGVYVGSTYSLLTPPEVADDAAGDCADKFMGWATAAINGSTGVEKEEVAWVTDEYVIDDTHKDIYAVFATEKHDGPLEEKTSTLTVKASSPGTSPYTDPSTGVIWTYDNNVTFASGNSASMVSGAEITATLPSLATATTITMSAHQTWAGVGKVYVNMLDESGNVIKQISGLTSKISGTYNFATDDGGQYADCKYVKFKHVNTSGNSNAAYIKDIAFTFKEPSTYYINYITQCCTPWTPSLSYNSYTMQVGEEQDAVVGTYYGAATYTSSNPSSVEVNETTGHIKAVGGGTATISVTWAGDETYCEQSTSSQEITVNGSLQVTFNGNGADGGTEMEAQMVEYNVATKISKNTYTKTGYTFLGWNTDKDATSILYTDEQSVAFTAGVELFAIWSINAHKVTVQDVTGGTIAISPTTTTINYGTTVTATANLATGYNFVTWSATPSVVTFAEATNKSTTFSMPDADITLTASYTPILVTKIDLKKGADIVTALEFEKNVTAPVTLTTAFTPADALDKTVTWYSGNTNIVTAVDGILTAQGLGTAVVTATSTVVPSVYGSVSVTVYEWQDADPKYTLTNQPASTVYYETNKIDFANWAIKHNFQRSDDATKTKQEDVASSNWTVTLGGEVIANNYTLTTSDNGKALVIKVGETTLYNETLTVNEKAKHTYIDRVHGNETKVMIDYYTIPSLTNTTAKTEGSCDETHYVFKGWVAETNADAPTDENIIAAGGSAKAEADATFYAVWAERRNVTTEKTMSYGWEEGDVCTGWTAATGNTSQHRNGSKAAVLGSAGNIIQSVGKIASPVSIKYYVKKNTSNTTTSNIVDVEYSSTGTSNWNSIESTKRWNGSGGGLSNDSWTEVECSLTDNTYQNMYFRIYKAGSAGQSVDDVTFVYKETAPKDVDYITECVTRYKLSFDVNGGTGTAPEVIMLKEGGKTALPDATLTKDLNDLTGWNTKANGQGTHYDFGAEYTMGGTDAKLYAEFTPWTLNNITLDATNVKTEFYEDEYFTVDGLEVNASYTGANSGNHVVENISGWTTDHDQYLDTPFGHDYEGGVVTVSYQGKTATYNITITKLFNANFYVWGEYYATTAMDYDGYITMPVIPESDHLVYKDFVGWSKTQFDAQSSDPEMIDDFYKPTADGENFYAVFGRASEYTEKTMTIDYDAFDTEFSSYDWHDWTANENIYGTAFCTKENNSNNLQFNNKNEQQSTIFNYSMLPGEITSITINRKSADKAWTAYVGKDFVGSADKDLGEKDPTNVTITWTANEIGTGYRYFQLIETDDNTGAAYVSSFVIKYNEPTIYSWTTNWVEPDQVRTDLVVGNYGTVCVPYTVKVADRSGATFWNIETSNAPGYTNPTSVTIVEEEGDLVAGKPYIFCATETEMAMFFSGVEYKLEEHDGVTVPANGLYGNLTDGTITINPTTYEPGYFFVLQQKLYECGVNCTVAPNRGWVQAAEIQNMTTPSPAPRRVIGNPNGTPTGINNLNSDGFKNIEGARKYFHNNNIVIVNEGRIYNAQGIRIQ